MDYEPPPVVGLPSNATSATGAFYMQQIFPNIFDSLTAPEKEKEEVPNKPILDRIEEIEIQLNGHLEILQEILNAVTDKHVRPSNLPEVPKTV